MKKIIFLVLIFLLPGKQSFSQYHYQRQPLPCQECEQMARSMHLSGRQAIEYHKIIHRYSTRIQIEIRKSNGNWDRASRRIYDLRIERDRKLQALLQADQFNVFFRLCCEVPSRIHDRRLWIPRSYYANRPPRPHQPWDDGIWWKGRYEYGRWCSPQEIHGHIQKYPPSHRRPEVRGNDRRQNTRRQPRYEVYPSSSGKIRVHPNK